MADRYSFDSVEGDVFFCTADFGWITGHSYVAYGPLLNGATQVTIVSLCMVSRRICGSQ